MITMLKTRQLKRNSRNLSRFSYLMQDYFARGLYNPRLALLSIANLENPQVKKNTTQNNKSTASQTEKL